MLFWSFFDHQFVNVMKLLINHISQSQGIDLIVSVIANEAI